MLFNWQVKDVCIVFEFWHIHNILELVMSCLAIFLIAAGYEYIRVCFASCEQWSQAEKKKVAGQNALVGNGGNEEDCETANQGGSFLRKNMILARYSYREQALRSIIYAFLVAVSFWLMLVFMTYNGYLMIAVVLGAGIGHFLFGNGKSKATHDLQCH
ncbi:Ctr copper transporter [Mycotypha africana]|uniref:Ctr copper transporter n=1 Tax=Mycotypha africana TaxID=64632 RepID=UPI0023013465|nr:Ctr copper transporter [Mycotypha africana]KAI8967815.1 Ctr copper transporter [Mycotypha africana]